MKLIKSLRTQGIIKKNKDIATEWNTENILNKNSTLC